MTLSIQKKIVEKTIKIGQLFNELNFSCAADTEFSTQHKVKVLNTAGYENIQGYMTTEPLQKVTINLIGGKTVTCAQKHRVYTTNGWTYAVDLDESMALFTEQGFMPVHSLHHHDECEMMYDIQVENTHTFFTNGILSHNSHFLVQLGAEAVRRGLDVMHYTLELSEYSVGLRYDSYLCGINCDVVVDEKAAVIKHYDETTSYGRLYIKEYPTGYPTVMTLKAHLDRLALKGFKPDLLIIDYADIMRSTRKFDSLRHELKLVYEQLRNLAAEADLPVWSASQANRSSANADIVGLENLSEAYSKAMVSDVILSLSRKAEEKALGTGRLFIAKNRAGRDGLVFDVKIDTAQSRFEIASDYAHTLAELQVSDDGDVKAKIKAKLNKIRSDRGIPLEHK